MTAPVQSSDAYADLPAMQGFDGFSDFDAYTPLPDDWMVFAGDVKGSTAAIQSGRYKDVNMVGAAVITAVLNTVGAVKVPFVFGGDGGLVAVPPVCAGAARDALCRLVSHAGAIYALELRAVALPVSRIRAEGHDLSVRKYALSSGNDLALFAGGGVEHVDTIMKQAGPDDPAHLHPDPDAAPPDLSGLSCRWEPLEATRSLMVALLAQPLGTGHAETFARINTGIAEILSRDVPGHAPATDGTMRFRWPPRGLRLERRAATGGQFQPRVWFWTLFTALMQKVCHWRGVKIGDYDGPRYFKEVQAQTDFRKYDGCLRMVLDCSDAEIEAIRGMLEAEHQAGTLAYGLHADRNALMTCLVFSLARSEHIHFVDAAGGGFASAAVGLKAQLRARDAAATTSGNTS